MCYNNGELEHTYRSLANSHFASRPPGHGMKHGDPFYLTSLTSERTPSSQVLLTPSSFLLVQCTVTCGGGVQTRSVHCVQQGRPSSSCLLRHKPPVLRACNTNFCPAPAKRGNEACTPVTFTKSSESFPKLHRMCLCRLFLEQLLGGGTIHITICEQCCSEAYEAQIWGSSCPKCLFAYIRRENLILC